MAGPGFIHLHVHSGYSLLEGALPLERLIGLAKEDKQPALGIADTKAAIYDALPAEGVAVVNADDAFAPYFMERAHGRRIVRIGLEANGPRELTKGGGGTLVLSNTNTYTGATSVTDGTLIINGNISTSSLTTVKPGATLGGSGTVGKAVINGTLAVGNSHALGLGTLSLVGDTQLDANSNVSLNNSIALSTHTLTLPGTHATTLAGSISGSGALVKHGGSDLTLSGFNAFSGGVDLQAGRLVIGSDSALGSGVLTAAAGTTLDTDAARTVINDITLAGNATISAAAVVWT